MILYSVEFLCFIRTFKTFTHIYPQKLGIRCPSIEGFLTFANERGAEIVIAWFDEEEE